VRDEGEDLEALGEELSALVDGELDPEREAQLRARAAREPELARRLESFQRLDAALRALPGSEVSDDLAARLRERIVSEPARVIPLRRRLITWGAPAAALAAGLLLVLVLSRGPGPGEEEATSVPLVRVPVPSPVPAPESAGPEPPSETTGPALDLEFAEVPEEELGVAVELDTLADFEVIEQLELLELLAALDDPEQG
jgi:hypothetical protein